MGKVVIAIVAGIAIALVVSYFLFKEIMVVPSIIGIISFFVAYMTLNKKK